MWNLWIRGRKAKELDSNPVKPSEPDRKPSEPDRKQSIRRENGNNSAHLVLLLQNDINLLQTQFQAFQREKDENINQMKKEKNENIHQMRKDMKAFQETTTKKLKIKDQKNSNKKLGFCHYCSLYQDQIHYCRKRFRWINIDRWNQLVVESSSEEGAMRTDKHNILDPYVITEMPRFGIDVRVPAQVHIEEEN